MIAFKQFLMETSVDQAPRYKKLELEEAIKLLETRCKKNLWMVHEDRPFYRGDTHLHEFPGFVKKNANAYTVDTSLTERMSTNTNNIYTEIFDNHPKMKSFPKRSRSFIASTSSSYAWGYGGIHGRFVLIPYDTAKVGIVGKSDIWGINSIEMFNRRIEELSNMNRILESMLKGVGISNMGIKGLQQFAKMLTNPKSKSRKVLLSVIMKEGPYVSTAYQAVDDYISEEDAKEMVKEISKDFMQYIFDNFDPSALGLKSGAQNAKNLKNSEVWVGGNVLIFDRNAWAEVKKHFGVE